MSNAQVSFLRPDLVALTDDGSPRPGSPLQLVASYCDACHRYEFPPRATCPACQRPTPMARLGPDAVLVGFTSVLHPPPGALVDAPYHVGVARYEGGISVIGLLVDVDDLDDVRVGTPVETTSVEIAPGRLTYGFRPVAG